MRILIVRHGDPDYEKDSLTEKGWKEAALLADRIAKEKIDAFYVSPLGRAKATASLTLEKMGRTAKECAWLREFSPAVMRPDLNGRREVAWDWLPKDWANEPIFYDPEHWFDHPVMEEAGVKEVYEWVIKEFDALLAKHGYVRDGENYRAERANTDTIALYCHFGLECVLLAHLMHVSPMVLWHHTCAAPTSVSTIYTEERTKGIAAFRMQSFGDVSHLYAGNEEIAFAARFCETYDGDQRH